MLILTATAYFVRKSSLRARLFRTRSRKRAFIFFSPRCSILSKLDAPQLPSILTEERRISGGCIAFRQFSGRRCERFVASGPLLSRLSLSPHCRRICHHQFDPDASRGAQAQ